MIEDDPFAELDALMSGVQSNVSLSADGEESDSADPGDGGSDADPYDLLESMLND